MACFSVALTHRLHPIDTHSKSEPNISNRPTSEPPEAQQSPSFADTAPTLSSAKPVEPGLYVVATPIGNLRDITLRALDVLQAADRVLAEDTRVTGKLLAAHGISASLTAYHDHNAAKRAPGIIKQMAKRGEIVALVSDAGTPLVSDPGYRLVRAAVDADVPVYPVPGASSVMAALVKSGQPSDRFHFAGFLPPKTAARSTAIAGLKAVQATLILFETGPRVEAALRDLASGLGERDAVLTRELTKTFEEARRGTLTELADGIVDDPPRGEIVLVIAPPEAERWAGDVVSDALREALVTQKLKAACAEVAEVSGWSKRELYALGLTLK